MADYNDISRDELKQWMGDEKPFVLIDVLPEASYTMRHLPSAENVSVRDDEFLSRVGELVPNKDTPIVVYCSSFSCQLSPLAASKLADAEYTNVYDYAGGLADWIEGEYPLEGEMTEETKEGEEE